MSSNEVRSKSSCYVRTWLRTTYRFSATSSHTNPLNRLTNIAVYIHCLTKVTSPKHCGSATLHSPLILYRPIIDRCPVLGILTLNPSSLMICFSGFGVFLAHCTGFQSRLDGDYMPGSRHMRDGRIRRYFSYLLLNLISNLRYGFCGFRVWSHITQFTHWHSGFFWLS